VSRLPTCKTPPEPVQHRVYDVLEQVLIRNTLKQEHKIKVEIKSDITKKEKMLKKPDCMGASS
jgi:hypothetical protein